ncbi:MAG: right-handed parallel beta-helix repeat-containing protein [Rubrivivax sp.]|nr:MAG: right-handed parallel beta-helix repeat-containing protein [Rubrivivax sp.]
MSLLRRCRMGWLAASLVLLSACDKPLPEPPTDAGASAQAQGQSAAWSPGAKPPPWACAKAMIGSHATYHVGPGQQHLELASVPWLSLQAGDVVNVHWRAQPYRTKIGLRAQGLASNPVVINGVTNEHCQRPEISGQNAQIAQDAIDEHYFSAGGTNALGTIFINKRYADPTGFKARHIRIQNLKITGASSRQPFVAEDGKPTPHLQGAAGIYAVVAEYLTVDNCELTGNDNGVFVNTREDIEGLTSRHIVIRHNVIHLNGVPDSGTEHNLYVQASQVLYEGNFIGQLVPGANGSSLKDRSSGTVIRYNHIVAAARALDLVETEGGASTVAKDADYHRAWVVGNVIVSDMNKPGNSSVKLIHWGGDNHPEVFRKGPLYFYNNTVIMRGTERQAAYFSVFDMPTDEQVVQAQDNIFWRDGSAHLYLGYKNGTVQLVGRNWVSSGWGTGKRGEHVVVQTQGTVLEGDNPGLDAEYQPQPDSPVQDQGGSSLASAPTPEHVLNIADNFQYLPLAGTKPRPLAGAAPDLGALEGF